VLTLLRIVATVIALGCSAGCLPGSSERIARVGYLGNLPFDNPATREVLKERLSELGWMEGKNLVIEWRYSDNTEPRLSELAAELARTVDVVAVDSEPPARAMLRASSTIPIVLVAHPDPVAAGLAESLARPGGQVTGAGGNAGFANSKRVELLKDLLPGLKHLGVLHNPTFPATVRTHLPEVQAAATVLGLEIHRGEVRAPSDLSLALQQLAVERIDGLIVIQDPVIVSQQRLIVDFLTQARIPAVYSTHTWLEHGGLMSYSVAQQSLFQQAGTYIDRILRGANPAELPMERPSVMELNVNASAADALGLTISPSFAMQVTRWTTH
jgi:putative ABC transport system substrate-binding protein